MLHVQLSSPTTIAPTFTSSSLDKNTSMQCRRVLQISVHLIALEGVARTVTRRFADKTIQRETAPWPVPFCRQTNA